MKHLIAFITISLLVGCSVDNSHLVSNSYTDEQHDEVTGLTLKPSENMWVSFPEMVAIYEATEACMGMTATGPTVYFKSFKEYFNGAIGGVWAFHVKGTIYVNTDENIPAGIERNKDTDTQALRHEYIHNILFYYTGNGDASHSSEMYGLCGRGVDVHN